MQAVQEIEDVIERQVVIAAPRERVWTALTEADQLKAWFASGGCRVDLRVGGEIFFDWNEVTGRTRILELEPPRRLVWSWVPSMLERADEPLEGQPQTIVEWMLEESVNGSTTLTARETGFASLTDADRERAYPTNFEGWRECLAMLTRYVEA